MKNIYKLLILISITIGALLLGRQDSLAGNRVYLGSYNQVSSSLTVSTSAVNLKVCSPQVPYHSLYVVMYRSAANGYPARTWNYIVNSNGQILYAVYRDASSSTWSSISGQVISSRSGNCTTISNMDGNGNTFAGVYYNTAASLGDYPSDDWPSGSCYVASSGFGLCDSKKR